MTCESNVGRMSDVLEFDVVVRVHPDGSVTNEPNVFAPSLYDGELGTSGWTLMDGYSGQQSYSGPIMHASEYVAGRMERDILANPGLYVALVDYPLDDGEPDGWAVAHKPCTAL